MRPVSENYNEDDNRNFAQDMLWSRRIKATRPRMEIVNLLIEVNEPVSILEILTKSKSVSTASVYRILDLLIKHNMVSKSRIDKNKVVYEMMTKKKRSQFP
jgi:Fe2+ or Zn2+ uptake regulation protein